MMPKLKRVQQVLKVQLKRLANSMLAAPIKFYHQSLPTSPDHLSKLSSPKKRTKLLKLAASHISKPLLEKLYQRFQPSPVT
jgi:hypothetical protein